MDTDSPDADAQACDAHLADEIIEVRQDAVLGSAMICSANCSDLESSVVKQASREDHSAGVAGREAPLEAQARDSNEAQSACQKGKSSLIAGLRDGSLNRIVDEMEASKNASAPTETSGPILAEAYISDTQSCVSFSTKENDGTHASKPVIEILGSPSGQNAQHGSLTDDEIEEVPPQNQSDSEQFGWGGGAREAHTIYFRPATIHTMGRPMSAGMARPMSAGPRPMHAGMARPMSAGVARPMSAGVSRPVTADGTSMPHAYVRSMNDDGSSMPHAYVRPVVVDPMVNPTQCYSQSYMPGPGARPRSAGPCGRSQMPPTMPRSMASNTDTTYWVLPGTMGSVPSLPTSPTGQDGAQRYVFSSQLWRDAHDRLQEGAHYYHAQQQSANYYHPQQQGANYYHAQQQEFSSSPQELEELF